MEMMVFFLIAIILSDYETSKVQSVYHQCRKVRADEVRDWSLSYGRPSYMRSSIR